MDEFRLNFEKRLRVLLLFLNISSKLMIFNLLSFIKLMILCLRLGCTIIFCFCTTKLV